MLVYYLVYKCVVSFSDALFVVGWLVASKPVRDAMETLLVLVCRGLRLDRYRTGLLCRIEHN